LINKASLGLIITDSDLPTQKQLLDLVKKENPGLSEQALQSLTVENISKEGSTITSKNKDDFSGEIKLEYRSRTNSEQE
ncbi:BspA family leucine-rich repeat surface protein, partial [Xanthomonas citri pv. citri]|nr:BspA family leucine-rich repeat surface protein [Xanthomonas citri pv. citri]